MSELMNWIPRLALLYLLVAPAFAQAQFILKPSTKLDFAMNAAFASSYAVSILDSRSTVKALQNPVVRYREANPLYNAFVDKYCSCSSQRVALGLGYTAATNLAFHYAYNKSGDSKLLKGVVIVGRFAASAILIPTIRQNLRNGRY